MHVIDNTDRGTGECAEERDGWAGRQVGPGAATASDTRSVDPSRLRRLVEEARRILFGTRRTPLPGPRPVRFLTRWIPDTVVQQGLSQAGLTLQATCDFAARHGMTFHLDRTPAGANRFVFRLGDIELARSATIRGALAGLLARLEVELIEQPDGAVACTEVQVTEVATQGPTSKETPAPGWLETEVDSPHGAHETNDERPDEFGPAERVVAA